MKPSTFSPQSYLDMNHTHAITCDMKHLALTVCLRPSSKPLNITINVLTEEPKLSSPEIREPLSKTLSQRLRLYLIDFCCDTFKEYASLLKGHFSIVDESGCSA